MISSGNGTIFVKICQFVPLILGHLRWRAKKMRDLRSARISLREAVLSAGKLSLKPHINYTLIKRCQNAYS